MTNSLRLQWSAWLGAINLLLAILWIGSGVGASQAHPWGGLVVDSSGTLYFTFVCPMEGEDHYACVWEIDEGDPVASLVSSHSPSDIVLHRTAGRQLFAGERFGSGAYRSRLLGFVEEEWQEVVAPGLDGPLFSVNSFAVSDSGYVVFSVENRLYMRDQAGSVEEIFEDHKFNRFGPMAWGESGKLVVVSGDDLLTISLDDEMVEVMASGLRKDSPQHLPFSGANILFDIAVDSEGTAFIAYYGNRQVLSVGSDGDVSVLVQSESPWSPHGVDVLGEYVYFLESTVGGNPWWKIWAKDRIAPRVRRVSVASGTIETIYNGL